MSGENRNIAGKLTRKALIWSGAIVLCLSYFIFSFAGWATREFYTESYHNKMLVTYEYTRRVLSDVYVAVTNNIYYLEQHLDDSDYPKGVMERIVHNGTRVRSCGISFIEDYYYPERGHRFCPFAWRNSANPDIIYPESGHILKENFFKHFDQSDDAEVKALADKVKGDVTSERESSISYDYDGSKCYLFYTPLKYTQWTMVTVVPAKTIGILGFINGFMLLLIVILFMLIAVAVYHYFVASYVEPL